MATTTKTKNQGDISLDKFWADFEANLKDTAQKVKLFKNSKTKYGIAIIQYPAGIPLSVMEKVCNGIKKVESFDTFDCISIEAGHRSAFYLVRNNSCQHKDFEKIENQSGGIKSAKVNDVGEFRIVHVDENNTVINGADFSLYRTQDDFVL